MAEHNSRSQRHARTCRATSPEKVRRWRMLRATADRFAAGWGRVPPVPLKALMAAAEQLGRDTRATDTEVNVLTVMLHNALWRSRVGAIPYHRRMLLLPQCLRSRESCPAKFDAFGLVCIECGGCPLGELQHEAEKLGLLVLIAEGTAPVTNLLAEGQVDAVIGVSCLKALEQSFPTVVSQAIPSIAVPLFRDGCDQTDVDLEWVREVMTMKTDGAVPQSISVNELRAEVSEWFRIDQVRECFGGADNPAARLAVDWLGRRGKRWRPFLTAAVYDALEGEYAHRTNETVTRAAVATECFHKASLVHDDIEDAEEERYERPTLHREYGVPIALNVGDFLLGEGYRLLAEVRAPAEQKTAMLRAVARAHRRLCMGQGAELMWRQEPKLLPREDVIAIFRGKTAPAFEVSLRLGAICAGREDELDGVLSAFSETLGIAYQIQDDLRDFDEDLASGRLQRGQPSLLLSLLCESEHGTRTFKPALDAAFGGEQALRDAVPDLGDWIDESDVHERARHLQEAYRDAALEALEPVQNVTLKSLLVRVVYQILS